MSLGDRGLRRELREGIVHFIGYPICADVELQEQMSLSFNTQLIITKLLKSNWLFIILVPGETHMMEFRAFPREFLFC